MPTNPFAPAFEDLPESLPIFPLAGVLLLPGGQLPLNIFEPRYLKMVNDALAGPRMIGMIQPKNEGAGQTIYDVGCAGKITEFSETTDGRYQISLAGICRFRVQQEKQVNTPYRQVTADWNAYENDLISQGCLGLDRKKLAALLQSYFPQQGLSCDWSKVEEATDNRLITCLSMICPFDAREKQVLLEAPCSKTRAEIFMSMLEIAVHDNKAINPCASKH